MRLPRELDPVEVRVLGSLLEKQQTTPDLYPLTLNALVAASNQRSNREPVMDLSERDVLLALNRLRDLVLAWKVEGARSEKWEHNLDARWELDGAGKALITLLLLRGQQTPGELRSRSDRMHPFTSLEQVEETLTRMSQEPEPLVFELPRRPGQKEVRWSHLVSGVPPGSERAPAPLRAAPAFPVAAPPPPPPQAPAARVEPPQQHHREEDSSLAMRVDELEARVAELAEELAALKERLR